MTTQPFWLKTLEGAIEEAKIIPLWGSPPLFPWKDLSKKLAALFEQKSFEISHQKTQWLPPKEFTIGMGDDPLIQPFALSPLPGDFFWVMPLQSKKTLTTLLLTKDQKIDAFSEHTLQEGFFQFVCLSVCDTFNQNTPYGNLSASLIDDSTLPQEQALCIDISISCSGQTLWGRVICPRETQQSFKTHFAMEKPPLFSDPSYGSIPIGLHLEAGSTTMTAKQWTAVKPGDFVLLDRCTFNLENNRGNALLVLGSTPLFDIRIKDGEVKILEYALHQEEGPMTDEFPEEDEIPIEESLEEEIPADESLEEEPVEEEMLDMEEETDKESPLWATKGEDETEKLISSTEIPITITMEIGRVQMPLQKLTQLQPGNILDLSTNPQAGVYLTVGGKRVAKGELVQLGESLGVKILKIGD